MTANDMRSQLQGLRIDRNQRPVAARSGGRWIKALIFLAIIGGVGFGAWSSRDWMQTAMSNIAAPPAVIPTLVVTERTAEADAVVLTATGKIVSDHLVAVATKVSGQITALHFEQGDFVEKGQIIARLEETNYRAMRDQSQAQLDKSKAALTYQETNYARIERLYKKGESFEIEYADALRARDEARAQVAADRAMLDFTQKQLDDCRVVTPIAGVVLEREVEVGDFVAAEGGRGAIANALFATIADMTQLRVEVDIMELDIHKVRAGMPCRITPDAYPDVHFNGHVMWLDPGANYSKGSVQVKVRIDDPDRDHLRVEGTATVVFRAPDAEQSARERAGIWVPAKAVMMDEDSTDSGRVFVVDNGKWKQREVTIAVTRDNELKIAAGLSPGDRIATADLDKITENDRYTAPS
jgi:RND family efflux transporter MFP subunit